MSYIAKPCVGCSHPTICRTHGCSVTEVLRNKSARNMPTLPAPSRTTPVGFGDDGIWYAPHQVVEYARQCIAAERARLTEQAALALAYAKDCDWSNADAVIEDMRGTKETP